MIAAALSLILMKKNWNHFQYLILILIDIRLKAEEERVRKEEDKARREFIKQEYLRRKQLKLMEDMDTVIKPRASSGGKQRRGRPKSIHRDSLDSPKTPVRAATGNQGDGPSVLTRPSHLSTLDCLHFAL